MVFIPGRDTVVDFVFGDRDVEMLGPENGMLFG
jgi:hypothetical protein